MDAINRSDIISEVLIVLVIISIVACRSYRFLISAFKLGFKVLDIALLNVVGGIIAFLFALYFLLFLAPIFNTVYLIKEYQLEE